MTGCTTFSPSGSTPKLECPEDPSDKISPFASDKWVAGDHQCVRHPCNPWRSSHTFSRSGGVAQLIIMGWSGSEFHTGNSSIKLQKWRSEVWSWSCRKHKIILTPCNFMMPLKRRIISNKGVRPLQYIWLLNIQKRNFTNTYCVS